MQNLLKKVLVVILLAEFLNNASFAGELVVYPTLPPKIRNSIDSAKIDDFFATDEKDDDKVPKKDNLFWTNSAIHHFSFGEKLPNMIRDFCSIQDISIVLSDQVLNSEQKINRSFRDVLPVDVWEQLTKTYGLLWFYDGNILYVYTATENITKVLQIGSDKLDSLLNLVNQLGFYSSRIDIKAIKDAGVLIVSGPPKFIALLEDLAKNIQIAQKLEVDDTCIKFFKLKHAWALDKKIGNILIPGVASTLNTLLGSKKEKTKEFSQKDIDLSDIHRVKSEKGVLDEFSSRNNKEKAEKEQKNEDKQEQNNNSIPAGGLITTDSRQNAVIVRDSLKNMHFYEDLIAKIDVPLELIEIKAAIIAINNNASFGAGTNSIELKSNKSTHHVKIYPLAESTSKSNTFDIKGIVNGGEFLTAISALESANSAKLLARPSVITMDNLEAVMDRSETIYRRVSGEKVTDMYPITSSTTLKVTPHIILDENNVPKIQLILDIKDGKNIADGGSDPNISSSSIITQAAVYEGQSVLVGGYFQESQEKSDSGIPVLKDIPFLGYAFKNKSKSKSVAERLFLITPTIIRLSSGVEDPYKDYFKNVEEGQSLLDTARTRMPIENIDDIIKKYEPPTQTNTIQQYTPTSRIFNH